MAGNDMLHLAGLDERFDPGKRLEIELSIVIG